MIQKLYDNTIRPHLPRKIGVYNGYPARVPRLFDTTDVIPEFEMATISAIKGTVRPDDSVVVVGAGYGITTVCVAEISDDVTAYEAASEKQEPLEETMEINGVSENVSIVTAIVGDLHHMWGEEPSGDVVSPGDIPECDVLELDCEGAEKDILPEMEIRPRALIVETHPRMGSPTEPMIDMMRDMDYDCVVLNPKDVAPVILGVRE